MLSNDDNSSGGYNNNNNAADHSVTYSKRRHSNTQLHNSMNINQWSIGSNGGGGGGGGTGYYDTSGVAVMGSVNNSRGAGLGPDDPRDYSGSSSRLGSGNVGAVVSQVSKSHVYNGIQIITGEYDKVLNVHAPRADNVGGASSNVNTYTNNNNNNNKRLPSNNNNNQASHYSDYSNSYAAEGYSGRPNNCCVVS